MAEVLVGKVHEFSDDQRKFVWVDGQEVAVFQWKDRFYAFENTCPHMGGPVGEGDLVEKPATADHAPRTELVCPNHGWTFDIETGEFTGRMPRSLTRFEVIERDDSVYLVS